METLLRLDEYSFMSHTIWIKKHTEDYEKQFILAADKLGYFPFQDDPKNVIHIANIDNLYTINIAYNQTYVKNLKKAKEDFVNGRNTGNLRHSDYIAFNLPSLCLPSEIINQHTIRHNKDASDNIRKTLINNYWHRSVRIFDEFPPIEFLCKKCLRIYNPHGLAQLELF